MCCGMPNFHATPAVIESRCGSCTACCDGHLTVEVNGVQVRPGHPCPNRVVGGGCTIYNTRPEVCQKFVCRYLLDISWDVSMRPDQCGLIVYRGSKQVAENKIRVVQIRPDYDQRVFERIKQIAQSERFDIGFVLYTRG